MIEHGLPDDSTPLEEEQAIRFHCHPELECFNACCRNKRLTLLPYDLLRLRRALDLTSDRLLEAHVALELDPEAGWPLLRIQLAADGRCPFVGEQGCAVYEHRPTCCRIFPLGRAIAPGGVDDQPEEHFFATSSPTCLGWQATREITVRAWLAGQGLAEYHAANNRVMQLFLHPRRPRPFVLADHQIHAVILGLYNLDVFRQALTDPAHAARHGLPGAHLATTRPTDEALLALGEEWLTAQLFG